MSNLFRAVLATWLTLLTSTAQAAELPYVNWENNPVHALDISPDRSLLAVAHTSDQRVQLFNIASGTPIALGHVLVGVDPVSVRFRSDSELWVVNHISDSVSVIDVPSKRVRTTLQTSDEPFDVVFARGQAFVSCSQANRVEVFDLSQLTLPPKAIAIQAEDPRALAVSPDGAWVYAAIFESGNASTALGGGFVRAESRIGNIVGDPRGPYGGQNPPPNSGASFVPALNPAATPPKVSLIVRRDANRRWMDDNQHDWTRFVSGELASASGRVQGWDVVDRDIAIINTATLAVRYATGLMNIGMAIAVKASGEVSLVGTDATNEVRYEPNVKGRFVHVELAQVPAGGQGAQRVSDLNPHLDYVAQTLAQPQRDNSIGDPRAIVWRTDGARGWVAGMGSNNVIVIDSTGKRVGAPIRTGAGTAALALDEPLARLYAWNHFDATLSVIDTNSATELRRLALFNPLPSAIREGRAFLYDTQRTSGLGQASCASCHVDARMDKLAWDLGDPALPPAAFDQNCVTVRAGACQPYHAMKGPMTTQTMQDIIGHEPLHWRGDRASIEAFNPAFVDLLGDDQTLKPSEMAAFKNYLRTIVFPPNPFRPIDNSLPEALELTGQRTSGRFAMAGLPLGIGNAKHGLELYSTGFLDNQLQCAACHTLPTGMAVNGSVLASILNFPIGTGSLSVGMMGENHLGVVSTDGFSNVSIKVPQTRNLHEKVGMEFTTTESLSGFGFAHDGTIDSLADFFSASLFSPTSDQDVADLVALSMAFSGSEFGNANPPLSAPAPLSKDTHAAVGQQLSVTSANLSARAETLLMLARTGKIDLIATQASVSATEPETRSYLVDAERFQSDGAEPALSVAAFSALASTQAPQTWTAVPKGLGKRLAIDRDGDGVSNQTEIRQGSNPSDSTSNQVQPVPGLWHNAARGGHGVDVQFSGNMMFATWFTYQDDGTPTWYLAVAPYARPWRAPISRYTFNPVTQRASEVNVGQMTLTFSDARTGVMDWQLGTRRGSEPLAPLIGGATPIFDRTGNWYDPTQPGWGAGIYTQGGVNFSVLYFYDANNQPRWVVGQSALADSASETQVLAMQSTRGGCPDCPAQTIVYRPGGELRFQFNGARAATIRTDVFDADSPSARWQRGPSVIEPLSTPALNPRRQ
jgi:YVTN family beta-propeller protein